MKNLFSFIWSKLFVKLIGLAMLVYLVVLGALLLYLDISTHHGEKIAVPNLIGKHIDNIEDLLDDSGLDYLVLDSVYQPNLPSGTILKQIPEPTSRTRVFVKSSRVVEISLSKKFRLITVPDLIHKSKRYAESILKNRGFKYKFSCEISPNNLNAVISQKLNGKRLRPGDKIPFGSEIHLIIGKGSHDEPFEVPNLYGYTLSQADSVVYELPSVSLIIGECIGCKTKRDTLKARVYGQTPEANQGNMRPPGSDIVLFLDLNFVDSNDSQE